MLTEREGALLFSMILFLGEVLFLLFSRTPKVLLDITYDSGGEDYGTSLSVDDSGNIFVAGYSIKNNSDFRVMRYSREGEIMWNRTYDSGEEDKAQGIGIDSLGSVYVTGYSGGFAHFDYKTLKYDKDGRLLWNISYDRLDDGAFSIAVGKGDFFYLTGLSGYLSSYDCLTLKYSKGGHYRKWERIYDSGKDEGGYSIALDKEEDVYIAGVTGFFPEYDFLILKYDKDGNLLWKRSYDLGGDERAYGIDVDTSENVYVAGYTSNTSDNDYLILVYDKDGNLKSKIRYDGGYQEIATSITVDLVGDIYVTGYSDNGISSSSLTLKYDRKGRREWEIPYNIGNNRMSQVRIDGSGYIYLIGTSFNGKDYDSHISKYRQFLSISGYVKDGEGKGISGMVVELDGTIVGSCLTDSEGFYKFTDLPCGECYRVKVEGGVFSPRERKYCPLGTNQRKQDFTLPPGKEEEAPHSSSLWVPTVSMGKVEFIYRLPTPGYLNLSIYDVSGRRIKTLIEGFYRGKEYRGYWVPPSSGVYLLRVEEEGSIRIVKIVVTKSY